MTTAVAKRDTAHIVIEGAGLDPEEWQPARIAALNKLLPPKFQGSTENLIALASLVDRTGLDPFIKELYAWEDKGRVTYHVGRDGWLKIAKRDPDIHAVSSGVIHENDKFSYERDDTGRIHIHQSGSFPQGALIGAWAVVVPVDGSDQLVTRELSYYKHLLGKDNWRNYPAEMLETRVLATAIKFVSKLAAGLYAPGEAVDDDYAPTPAPGIAATQNRAQALGASLKEQPIEGEVVELEIIEEIHEPTTVPASDPQEVWDCTFCGQKFDSPQGLSSHSRTHKEEKRLIAIWENDGLAVHYDENDGWAVLDGNGEIIAAAVMFEDLLDQVDAALKEPEPEPDPEPIVEDKATVTAIYKAMHEADDEGCDELWLEATLKQFYEGRGLFKLTEDERAEVIERIRDTFGD